jgi:hypothetical protein
MKRFGKVKREQLIEDVVEPAPIKSRSFASAYPKTANRNRIKRERGPKHPVGGCVHDVLTSGKPSHIGDMSPAVVAQYVLKKSRLKKCCGRAVL